MILKNTGKFFFSAMCAALAFLFSFSAAESGAEIEKQTLSVQDRLAQGEPLTGTQMTQTRDEAGMMRVLQMERAQEEAGLRMQREKCL